MRCSHFFSLALFLASPSAWADTIVLGSDPWCPYNCEPGSDRPGFMVEVAREALEPFGHTVEYRSIAWARALAQTQEGRINGVIGAVPDEAPEFVFGPPIGTYKDTIVFRQGEIYDVSDPANMVGLRVGAINGYEYYGPISVYISQNSDNRDLVQYASGDDALMINLRKLAAGRLDVVAEVRAVMEFTLDRLGRRDEFDVVNIDVSNDVFIAFSPSLESSQLYAEQLTEGVALLRGNGRFASILASYGLTDATE